MGRVASDTNHNPTVRAEIHCSAHRLRFGLAGESESELPVDLGFAGWVGVAQQGDDVAERLDQVGDLGAAHPAWLCLLGRLKISFGSCPFGLALGDPTGD